MFIFKKKSSLIEQKNHFVWGHNKNNFLAENIYQSFEKNIITFQKNTLLYFWLKKHESNFVVQCKTIFLIGKYKSDNHIFYIKKHFLEKRKSQFFQRKGKITFFSKCEIIFFIEKHKYYNLCDLSMYFCPQVISI